MTEYQIRRYLEDLERNLVNAPRLSVDLSKVWINTFPPDSGVYAIFENSEMIYVGETGNLRKRMSDLRNTMNHTLRRTLGEKLFFTRYDYIKASSSKKYSSEIEMELEKWMKENLHVSFIPVKLGRKELEESFLEKNSQFLNKRTKRK